MNLTPCWSVIRKYDLDNIVEYKDNKYLYRLIPRLLVRRFSIIID